MAGYAFSTLDTRFNRSTFLSLCEKFNLETSGNKKVLIERLITYVSQRLSFDSPGEEAEFNVCGILTHSVS